MMISCRGLRRSQNLGMVTVLVILSAFVMNFSSGTAHGQQVALDTVTLRSDFNNDGLTDILWRYLPAGDLAVWVTNTGGTSVRAVNSLGRIDPTWEINGIGDFNGDGSMDILWRHTSGTIVAWLMTVAGLRDIQVVPLGILPDEWQVQGVGDFNGDGLSDILWRHSSGFLAVWLMNGTGTAVASSAPIGISDPSWAVRGIGDFNSDGRFDILWQTPAGVVLNWINLRLDGNDPLPTSVSSLGAVPDTNWTVEGIGDFNGDGNSDVLWRHTTGSVVVWIMNLRGTAIASIPQFSGTDSSWAIRGVGDFNGNGRSDILWQHSSGTVVVWSMNLAGTTIAPTPVVFGAVPDLNWSIINFPTGTR